MQSKVFLLCIAALSSFALANPLAESNPAPAAGAVPEPANLLNRGEAVCAKAGKKCGPPKCCGDLHCGGAGLCV